MIFLPRKNNVTDKFLLLLSWLSGVIILGCFIFLIANISYQGFSRLSLDFIFSNPQNAGRAGGIAPMLVSTLLLIGIALLIALPIGIMSAIYLAEYTNEQQWFAAFIRRSLNVLASIPSIVMGMFGYVFFVISLGLGFSILSGGLTLASMILPLLIRNIEDSLRNISTEYRLNAASLGLSQFRTIFQILLPLAAQGIVLAVILSIGRVMAETAALLYTSGYVSRMPESLFDSGRSLSVHIFDLSMNVPGGEQSAYGSAFVLVFLLLLINVTTAVLSKQFQLRSAL